MISIRQCELPDTNKTVTKLFCEFYSYLNFQFMKN